MPSTLYREARSSLSSQQRGSLDAFTRWLAGLTATPAWLVDGKKILGNIQNESHLVGDGGFGNSQELAAFLRRCAVNHAKAKSPRDRHRGYETACQAERGRGLPIPRAHVPSTLYRYCTSKKLFFRIIERVLGATARQNVEDGLISPAEAFTRLAAAWQANRITEGETLARGPIVWATFDHPGSAPRDDAQGMAQTLGLPVLFRISGEEAIVFEFTYATDAVGNHRFPSVADAAWHHQFRPAKEAQPDPDRPETCCGWTEPLGDQEPQPEIVHDNESLRVLARAPRFIGRIAL